MAHSGAYQGLELDEDEAWRQFGEVGRTSQTILDQSSPIPVQHPNLQPQQGPGDADKETSTCATEDVVNVDGVPVPTDDGNAISENDTSTNSCDECGAESTVDFAPDLFLCADNLGSADLDEVHAIKKVEAEFRILQDLICESTKCAETDIRNDATQTPRSTGAFPTYEIGRRVALLQDAVKVLGSEEFDRRMQQLMSK